MGLSLNPGMISQSMKVSNAFKAMEEKLITDEIQEHTTSKIEQLAEVVKGATENVATLLESITEKVLDEETR